MDFWKQPVLRDTTPNAPREILARLATVLLAASALAALVCAVLWLGGRENRFLLGALIGTAAALALAATRRLATRPRPSGPAPSPRPAPPPSATAPRRLLLLDASLAGPGGNSSALLDRLATRLAAPDITLDRAALAGPGAADFPALAPRLRAAHGFVIATGTHWDSWSSPLQKFLEDATPAEATPLWLGKPAAVLVTEHSVGGKAVLSRLQGVLVTLGCALPPLSGLVLSRAARLARQHTPDARATEDFWSEDDLEIIAHNLLAALRQAPAPWRAWPVDRADYRARWL